MSVTLPLAFALEGTPAAVDARDGRRFLREGEVELALRDRERRLREQEQLLHHTLDEQNRLRRRLEELEGRS